MKKRDGRMTLACGLPADVLTSGARVTLMGRACVLVEGQRGVVELETERIRLRTRDGVLSVTGNALCLKELSADAAMITGERIDMASYEKPELR